MHCSPIHVAIVDAHNLFRKGIKSIIDSNQDFRVTAEVSDVGRLIESLDESGTLPDICIVDVNIPGHAGYQTVRQAKEKWPHLKFLALTMFENEYSIIKMLQSGASGFLPREACLEDLFTALHEIHKNNFYHSRLLSAHLLQAFNGSSLPAITDREYSFLEYCCTELTYKEIAAKMEVSTRTVEGYRDSLFNKLNINTRIGLVLFALRAGVVPL